MTKRKILAPLAGLLMMTACQQTPENNAVETEVTGALRCKMQTEAVDPSGLTIQGRTVAQAGERLSYSLNEDLSCSATQKVVWRTAGASSAKAGSRLNSSFKTAGDYVVSAKIENSSDLSVTEMSYKTVVVSDSARISAPQVTMVGTPVGFELALPDGLTLVSAEWDFGDGSPQQNHLEPFQFTYFGAGSFTVTVTTRDENQVTDTLTHAITVLPLMDGLECVSELAISGPTDATVGRPVTLAAFIPSCLTSRVTAVRWNLGDGSAPQNRQTVDHTYGAEGDYLVRVELFTRASSTTPWVTLTHPMHVTQESTEPDPTEDPDDPNPEDPGPGTDPDDENPLSCPVTGARRESTGDLYSETVACGLEGTRILSYRDRVVEECQATGKQRLWSEISRNKELQSEGPCQGQACQLADGSVLRDGAVLIGVITGEVKEALTCAFGEEGFFNLYHQLSDRTCANGLLTESNTRRGDVKQAGSCPVYQWTETPNWTACSADCGGSQARVHDCRNGQGELSPAERCGGEAPVVTRACDGNPEAVRREERESRTEEAGSSELCPANQIGVIVKTREVTQVRVFACLDHEVKLESENTEYGEWATEKYCRDYVAHRCSQDSLSVTEARARYNWMLKCQDQVPVIKEFLTNFSDVGVQGQTKGKKETWSLDSKGRVLYPTFMNRATHPEKPWIAPKNASAGCQVPSTVYVASVCVASCSTPEQQILAQARAEAKLRYVPFVEALTSDYAFVATLQSMSSMSSKAVQKTRVDQWVTEMMDSDHVILEFTMKSGGRLRITPNHPLVSGDGTMRMADEFKVGDQLVQIGGVRDPIVSIRSVNYFGKVYNVFVKSAELHKNIVVTNGYLNGTAFFQNEGARNLNRALFRDKLIKGVLPK